MSTDPFTEAARAEAERRWPRVDRRNKTAEEWLNEGMASGFVLGALWARDHSATSEPTDEEVYAVRLATHGVLSPSAARAALRAVHDAQREGETR